MAVPRFAAIEAGGTKFVCATGTSPADISDLTRIPTTTPAETVSKVVAYFNKVKEKGGPLNAIGIASFGPVELDESSSRWGSILSTPKLGCSDFNLAAAISSALETPVGFDTDVNGAALAEYRWGAAKGCDVSTYVTVGTGIGGGTVINGRPIHGLRHPEIGHILPPRHPADIAFAGGCPFHGACIEGLASGPAIQERWGMSLSDMPTDHEAHDIIAWYLGHLALVLHAVISPRRIIFGGGVTDTPGLLDRIREKVREMAGGYFGPGDLFDAVITAPRLGERAGILGAMILGENAWLNHSQKSKSQREGRERA
jgi:fructokinase